MTGFKSRHSAEGVVDRIGIDICNRRAFQWCQENVELMPDYENLQAIVCKAWRVTPKMVAQLSDVAYDDRIDLFEEAYTRRFTKLSLFIQRIAICLAGWRAVVLFYGAVMVWFPELRDVFDSYHLGPRYVDMWNNLGWIMSRYIPEQYVISFLLVLKAYLALVAISGSLSKWRKNWTMRR